MKARGIDVETPYGLGIMENCFACKMLGRT